MKRGKKGQITFIFVFFIAAMFIILLSAIFGPMMVNFNTEMYQAGEMILDTTDINGIQDANVRAAVQSAVSEAQAATQTNIEVGADLFQYGWILLLILTTIVIYLITRRSVEFQGGFI